MHKITALTIALFFLITGVPARANANWGTASAPVANSPVCSLSTLAGLIFQCTGRVVAVRVVTGAGTVTVATSDYIVVVNKASGAATTVNLFATPATGSVVIIKDGKGDAATNNITITPAAGNIDGAGTYVISTNYGSAILVYNGTQWNVLAVK